MFSLLQFFIIVSLFAVIITGFAYHDNFAFASGSGSAESESLLIDGKYLFAHIQTDPPILKINDQNVTMSIEIMNADVNPPVPISGVEYEIKFKDDDHTLLDFDVYSADVSSSIVIIPDATNVEFYGNMTETGAWIATPDLPLAVKAPVFLKGGLVSVFVTVKSIDMVSSTNIDDSTFEILFSMGEFMPFSIMTDDNTIHDLVFTTYFDQIDEFLYDARQKSVTATMPFKWNVEFIESIPFVHAEYYIPKTVGLFEDNEILLAVNGISYFGTVDRSGDDEIVVHFLLSSSKLLELLEQIPVNDRDKMIFEITSGKERYKEKKDASLEAGDALRILSSQEDWKFHVSLSPATGKIYSKQDVSLHVEFRDPVTNVIVSLISYNIDVFLDGVSVLSEMQRKAPDGKDTVKLNFAQPGSAIIQISNVNNYATIGEFAFQVSAYDKISGNVDNRGDNNNTATVLTLSSANNTLQSDEHSSSFIIEMAFGSFSLGCERDDSCYEPFELEISKGQTVSWINLDGQGHTVASGTSRNGVDGIFKSPVVGEGKTYDYTFDESGTFEYFCTLHPWMVGVIVVNEKNDLSENYNNNTDAIIIIPDWIKLNAQWWSQGLIDDVAFSESLEYLIKQRIIILPVADSTDSQYNEAAVNDLDNSNRNTDAIIIIPDWIKLNAQWWSQGLIDDDTFVGSVKWMIANNVIVL